MLIVVVVVIVMAIHVGAIAPGFLEFFVPFARLFAAFAMPLDSVAAYLQPVGHVFHTVSVRVTVVSILRPDLRVSEPTNPAIVSSAMQRILMLRVMAEAGSMEAMEAAGTAEADMVVANLSC